MSGAEALAVAGIVSNILQLTEFAAKVTDRTLEFAGKAAHLPGSFSDLRVVLAVVRLNLKKLQSRIDSTKPDKETLDIIKGLVKLIERDATIVQLHLKKYLPEPDEKQSWPRVTLKAIRSVFGEDKIKRSTDSIMQNCELLGQTVGKRCVRRTGATADRRRREGTEKLVESRRLGDGQRRGESRSSGSSGSRSSCCGERTLRQGTSTGQGAAEAESS